MLITKDKGDFSSHKDTNALHDDLVADLRSFGVTSKVELRENPSKFVEDFIKPTLKKLDDLKAQLEQGRPIDLLNYLAKNHDTVFSGIQELPLDVRFNGIHLEEPIGLNSLGRPSKIKILDVLELGPEAIYVEFYAVYEAEIFGYVSKFDAYNLEDESKLYITDANWNDHYAEVGAEVDLDVEMVVTFNPTEGVFLSFEVQKAEFDETF